jgi:hypothetical protein
VRWLAAAKAARKVGFVDRRSGRDRRSSDTPAGDGSDGLRLRKRDRRQHAEF